MRSFNVLKMLITFVDDNFCSALGVSKYLSAGDHLARAVEIIRGL
jgi:hypothetical protein